MLTKLVWKGEGKEVLVSGSFNNWLEKLPLKFNEDEKCWEMELELAEGLHEFKFVVNGEFVLSDDYEVVQNGDLKNNQIEVKGMFVL
jgi:1,4-alpha-glucan branching enzyme